MAQAFLAVILALVIGNLLSEPERWRRSEWFGRGYDALAARLGANTPPAVALLLSVALVLGLLYGLHLLLHFNALQFLLSVALLWLSLGPRELTRDVDAVIDARTEDGRALAAARLAMSDSAPTDGVAAAAIQAVQRWFAPILWFLLLGPLAAIAYRLLASVRGHADPARQAVVQSILRWAELPAAYALVLVLALASHLDAVWAAVRDAAQKDGWADGSLGFVGAAMHSVADSNEAASDGFSDELSASNPALARTVNLLQRSLFVWMTVLGLIVLVRAL
jgi:AmpE protein